MFAAVALALALTATGCSGGDVTPSFDAEKPWQQPGYEYCEYEVQKIYVGGTEDVVVAEGTYTNEIRTTGDNSTVKNTFRLTYGTAPETVILTEAGQYGVHTSLTDSYEAEATFKRDSLVPVSASKNFKLAQRPLCDDSNGNVLPLGESAESYTLPSPVKYSDPRSYSYTVDYAANTAHFVTTEGTTTKNTENDATTYTRNYATVEKDFNLSNNTRFDNEQLHYLVRALSNTKKKGSATFYLSNIYDSYLTGSYKRYTMSLSCADKTTDFTPQIDPEKFEMSDAEGELTKTEDGWYNVPCVQASVSLSAEQSGPPIALLVTDPSVTVAQKSQPDIKTNKVVVQITYTEYSPRNAKVAYKTVYTLRDYRTTYA